MTDDPTDEQLRALWAAVRDWIDEFEPRCAESMVQSDHVNLNLYQLGEAVCDIVGYYDYDDAGPVCVCSAGIGGPAGCPVDHSKDIK